MRSTSTYSSWLDVAVAAPVELTYLDDRLRRAAWARPGAVLARCYQLEAPLAARAFGTLWQARRIGREAKGLESRAESLGAELLGAELLGAGLRNADPLVTVQLLDPALVDDE